MSTDKNSTTRRQFLAAAGGVAAVAAMPGIAKGFHSNDDEEIRVALVGCGGRGGGAASNALSVNNGPIKLVAVADVFEDRLNATFNNLKNNHSAKMDVPEDRKFLGFNAYRHAMDELRPGDIVILTTPPAFRWVHYTYAIEKGLNVFMEKPVTTDGPASRKMLALNEKAKAKNLKVGVGLMSRHTVGLQQLHQRIDDGEMGDIMFMRGYRMHGPAASSQSLHKPDGMSHLEYQIRRFHSFIWASGGCFNDFYIHHVDHLCWMKNSWPVQAHGLGGRHYKENTGNNTFVDQNFDSYAVEYTFDDGTKFLFEGRCMDGAHGQFQSFVHGTKGIAVAARSGDMGGPQAIYKGQLTDPGNLVWQSTDRSNPYQNEWNVLIQKIRDGEEHNEVERGVYASLTSSMGRMSAHTGQVVTLDQAMNSTHELAPTVDVLTYHSDAPVMPGKDGLYPMPQPGRVTEREY